MSEESQAAESLGPIESIYWDADDIIKSGWRRARKRYDCHGHRGGIAPGDEYHFAVVPVSEFRRDAPTRSSMRTLRLCTSCAPNPVHD